MLKSRIILSYRITIVLFFFVLLFIRIQTLPKNSIFKKSDTEFIGRINVIERKKEYIKVGIKVNGENLSGNFYNTNIELNYNDLIRIKGNLKEVEKNSVFFGFSYKDYLRRLSQFYTIKIDKIDLLKENNNMFYKIKNIIIDRINKINGSSYLHAFLIGDTSYIDSDITDSYRINGISHLFSISGMHLSFFINFYDKLIKIKNKKTKFIIISLFLLFYSFLVGFTPSVLRASLLYIFNYLTKKPLFSLFTALILIILINPYNFFEIGFQLSFLMSFILIIFSKRIKGLGIIKQSLFLSTITLIASAPLMIFYFNQINVLSPIYNAFFVPFVSYLIFPLSFIVFIIPYFSGGYSFLVNILEKISYFLTELKFSIWIMKEPNCFVFIVLVVLSAITLYFIYSKKYLSVLLFFLFMLIYHEINLFYNNTYITVIDVGQGDSLMLNINHKTILIDTGGSIYSDLSKNRIIPYLKAEGILKINTLVLTHGDYDHMGEAINLVENFKVEKVIFNCGEFNEFEQDLIKILDKKKIPYYSCIKELNIEDNKLYFLNNKDYGNENDNSSVIYTELNNHKFLFMGDAGVEVEEDLIEKYNLKDIDVLKVGHHGSKTSSSEDFINKINPKYGVISVGKNNRYGHPNKEVLDNLKESKIYRTDEDGSIMFKIRNNKLKIDTCSP